MEPGACRNRISNSGSGAALVQLQGIPTGARGPATGGAQRTPDRRGNNSARSLIRFRKSSSGLGSESIFRTGTTEGRCYGRAREAYSRPKRCGGCNCGPLLAHAQICPQCIIWLRSATTASLSLLSRVSIPGSSPNRIPIFASCG